MARANQRLYRTADGVVVGEGDPRAAFLLAGKGDVIPDGYEVPDALNVADPDPDPDPEPEAESAVEEEPAVKADEPAEDKADAPAEDKAAPKPSRVRSAAKKK